jgi:hypothetical protein
VWHVLHMLKLLSDNVSVTCIHGHVIGHCDKKDYFELLIISESFGFWT